MFFARPVSSLSSPARTRPADHALATPRGRSWLAGLALALASLAEAPPATGGEVRLVSSTLDGANLTGSVNVPAIDGTGRHVAFSVDARNVGPPCTELVGGVVVAQAFLRDVEAGATACVSAGTGSGANAPAFVQSLSADGRLVVFRSVAGNLVAGCADPAAGRAGIFLYDTSTGALRCVVGDDAIEPQGGWISANGRFVAFRTTSPLDPACATGALNVLVRDLETDVVQCVGRSSSGEPAGADSGGRVSISADGRFVTFVSLASNLAPPCGGERHVFRRDTQTGTTVCVSVSTAGDPANAPADDSFTSISGDGRLVAFQSRAINLDPACANGKTHAFVRDVAAGTTRCVSVTPAGTAAGDLSTNPVLSADGRIVAFASRAPDLDPACANGVLQLFARDLVAGVTVCLSRNEAGEAADGSVTAPVVSADGRRVAFRSAATNLVPGDGNGTPDIFLVDVGLQAEPGLTITVNGTAFSGGQTLVVTATLTPGTSDQPVDAYVVVRLPDQSFLSVTFGGVAPGLVPIVTGLAPIAFTGEVFRYTFTGSEPAGAYTWLAGVTQPGTLSVLGSIGEWPFTVTP